MFSSIREGASLSLRLGFRSGIHLSLVGESRHAVEAHVGGLEGDNRTPERGEPRAGFQRSHRSNWQDPERAHEQSTVAGSADGSAQPEDTADRSDASKF